MSIGCSLDVTLRIAVVLLFLLQELFTTNFVVHMHGQQDRRPAMLNLGQLKSEVPII